MKYHKYKRMVAKDFWLENIIKKLACHNDLLAENVPVSRDFIRNQINYIAFHHPSTLDWDKRGGSSGNPMGVAPKISYWVAFTSQEHTERCSNHIGQIYAKDSAKDIFELRRLFVLEPTLILDAFVWFTMSMQQHRQWTVSFDVYPINQQIKPLS